MLAIPIGVGAIKITPFVWRGLSEGAEADLDAPGSDLEPVWTVLYANGKPGALRGGDPTPPTTRAAAEKIYKKKRDEKAGPHHYTPLPGLPFAPYARYFPVPLALPDQDAGSASPEEVLPPPTEQTPRYEASEAVLITREAFEQCIASPRYGATEKVDGERCLVASESERLSAYNRNGIQIRVVPDAASALGQLRASFVVDGERMVGDQAGQYVIFDLLEWQGSDARSWSAGRRIATLQQAMLEAGLLKAPRATPTLHEAFENSTISGLALLTPVSGLEEITCLMSVVQEQGGEGFVLRLLHEGGYLGPGPCSSTNCWPTSMSWSSGSSREPAEGAWRRLCGGHLTTPPLPAVEYGQASRKTTCSRLPSSSPRESAR